MTRVESFRDTNELANFCANVEVKSVFQEVEYERRTSYDGANQSTFPYQELEIRYKYVVFYEEKVK